MGGFYQDIIEQRKNSLHSTWALYPPSKQKSYEKNDFAFSSEMTLILLPLIICGQIVCFTSHLPQTLPYSSIPSVGQWPRIEGSHFNSLSLLSCRSLCFVSPRGKGLQFIALSLIPVFSPDHIGAAQVILPYKYATLWLTLNTKLTEHFLPCYVTYSCSPERKLWI